MNKLTESNARMNVDSSTSVDINLADLKQLSDPNLLPALARMRAHEPVYWSETMHGWFLTGYTEVAAAFRDRRILNKRVENFSFRAIPQEEWPTTIPNLARGIGSWIVNMDGAEHARLRNVFQKAFLRNMVDKLSPLIERLATEATDKAARLGTFDFMSEIAYPVPANVIFGFLGIPPAHLNKLRDWNHRVSKTVQTIGSREILLDGERALAELNGMLLQEVEKRRQAPQEDFLSELVALVDKGNDELSLDELLAVCQILLFAGQDTTVNSLCLGLLAFLQHPDQTARYLSGAVHPVNAMSEVTRFIAMSNCMFKLAGEDFELGGKHIKAGDFIFIMISAANHDPAAYPNPEKFDIERPNLDKIITFAPGIHMCIGHYLARLEMAIFFKTFLSRFSKIEVLDDPVRFQSNFPFRGLEHLNIRVR